MKEKIEEKLRAAFGDSVISVSESKGQVTVDARKEKIADICRLLKEDPELDFNFLSDVCGADMLNFEDASARKAYLAIEHDFRPAEVPVEERFVVIYNMISLRTKARLIVKVKVGGELPVCPSVTSVYPAANWYERETFDMFGITFEGHPDMRRMYMPEEYEYYPLRKDFPLMGVPGSIPLPRK
jgi:NADH-quinone oxidoreductase subunit C